MAELRELYQEIILDHNRNPRNFKKLADSNRSAEGYNPLCGDHYYLYMKLDEAQNRIADISFEGSGCAISKASASVMTSLVKGKSIAEAETLFSTFRRLVTGEEKNVDIDSFGKLAPFAGVSEFPSRIKCAILPWHTMNSALHGTQEVIVTEAEE